MKVKWGLGWMSLLGGGALLLLALIGCGPTGTVQPVALPSPTADPLAAAALATAQAAEAKAQVALDTAQQATQGSALALDAAQLALTLVESRCLLTVQPTATLECPLLPAQEFGVALRTTAGEANTVLYQRVTDIEVYRSYYDFEEAWLNNRMQQPGEVLLAVLAETAGLQLRYAESVTNTAGLPWTDWNLYVFSNTLPTTAATIQTLDTWEALSAATPFSSTARTVGESVLEQGELSSATRLVVQVNSGENPGAILIIFDPDAGAGGDARCSYCAKCSKGTCCQTCPPKCLTMQPCRP